MRMKLGDWFRVVQLVKWGGGGGKKKTLRMLCEVIIAIMLRQYFSLFSPVQFTSPLVSLYSGS